MEVRFVTELKINETVTKRMYREDLQMCSLQLEILPRKSVHTLRDGT